MHGQFSTKSDVYSFGVLVLEIVIGKRNSSFHETDSNDSNLVTSVSIQTETSNNILVITIRFQVSTYLIDLSLCRHGSFGEMAHR